MPITNVNRAMTSQGFKDLMAMYKKNNPVKFAQKKEEFARKLKTLQQAEGIKEEVG